LCFQTKVKSFTSLKLFKAGITSELAGWDYKQACRLGLQASLQAGITSELAGWDLIVWNCHVCNQICLEPFNYFSTWFIKIQFTCE